MKRILLVLSVVCVSAFAQNWILDTDTVLSNSQTPGVKSYAQQKRCLAANPGKTCVDFAGHNLRFERNVGGVWSIDAASKTAYDAEVAAGNTKKSDRVTRRNKLKGDKADINAAVTVSDLKPILKDMLKELNELNGTE